MRQELTHKIRSNPKFAELTQKRTKFGVQLSILMLLIYYGFILIVAFAPLTIHQFCLTRGAGAAGP